MSQKKTKPSKPRIVFEAGSWVCYNSGIYSADVAAQEFCWYLNCQQDAW